MEPMAKRAKLVFPVFLAVKVLPDQMASKESLDRRGTLAPMEEKGKKEIQGETVNRDDPETTGLRDNLDSQAMPEVLATKESAVMTDHLDQTALSEKPEKGAGRGRTVLEEKEAKEGYPGNQDHVESRGERA